MRQILEYREKPSAENISSWNKPIGGETMVDYSYQQDGQLYSVKLPYWVNFAIERHYVFPGYSLQDYLWGAINGFPVDVEDIKRAGFNLVAVCNEMGVGKSNLNLQFSGQVYGYERAGEWYPDWDQVLKYKIQKREEIIPMWRSARELGRIKAINVDDLDSIFSKELWFEDRPLYIKLRRAMNKIRPRVANMIVSAPSLNDIISILNTKITFEVMPFPDQTYMVERYCRFVDQFSSTSNFFRKILTEFSRFRLKDVPSSVYKEYDQGRMESEDEDIAELEKVMLKSGQKKYLDGKDGQQKLPYQGRDVPVNFVIDTARERGINLKQETAVALLKVHRELQKKNGIG